MEFQVIKTEKAYKLAMGRINELLRCSEGSPEATELELLTILAENYELEHYGKYFEDTSQSDPIDAICTAVDSMGLSKSDLIPYIGSTSKVNEILERKRNLTLPMIKKLHKHLHIPAEVLLQESRRKVA